MINPLFAFSPLACRSAKSAESLRPNFSDYGLMRARVHVGLVWTKSLAAEA